MLKVICSLVILTVLLGGGLRIITALLLVAIVSFVVKMLLAPFIINGKS